MKEEKSVQSLNQIVLIRIYEKLKRNIVCSSYLAVFSVMYLYKKVHISSFYTKNLHYYYLTCLYKALNNYANILQFSLNNIKLILL